MPLRSSVPKHNAYFEQDVILLDTAAIIFFAKSEEGMRDFDALLSKYSFIVPTPVIYELAFGPTELVSKNQGLLRSKFMNPNETHRMTELQYKITARKLKIAAGNIFAFNPGFGEWQVSREILLTHLHKNKGTNISKGKKEHTLDALIHACALNCFAPVCTLNVKDFEKFNEVEKDKHWVRTVPIYSPTDLVRSLSQDVVFPKNLREKSRGNKPNRQGVSGT